MPSLGPASEQERVVVLDVLRGLAVFGILTVNMMMFSAPARMPGYAPPPQSGVDNLIENLIAFFAVGKFYTLFSFLFGLGFALQLQRAAARGTPFLPIYARRLFLLLLIGLAHAVLLWDGDILGLYAVLGFLLLLFRHAAPRTLLMWAGVCVLLSIGLMWVGYRLQYGAGSMFSVPVSAGSPAIYASAVDEAIAIFGQGSYAEIVAYRLASLPRNALLLVLEQGPGAFAMFLFGLFVGRQRIFENATSHVPQIRKWLPVLLIGALVLNTGFVVGELREHVRLESVGLTLGAPLLCLSYIGGVILLVHRAEWQMRLRPVAAVGRMALTNYLLQSVICTTIFYGYGLALYGRTSATVGVLITLAIYPVQVAASSWWLKRFRFGPIEWMWRSLTYAQWQPLRRQARAWQPAHRADGGGG
jgi:uncharacterized protein